MSTEELMLLNCGVGEDSLESLDCKEIQPVHSKGDQPWDTESCSWVGHSELASARNPVFQDLC